MFSLLDVFLIVGVCQGLFVAFAMQFIQQKNKQANRILSYLILIACLMLLGRISWGKIQLGSLAPIAILADTTIFLFGPFLYLYVRRISLKEKSIFTLGFQHYLPAIIHLIYFCWYLFIPKETYASLYQEVPLRLFVFFIELVGLISCFFYWTKATIFLYKIKRLAPEYFSFEPAILRYLQFLLLPLFFCFFFWAISILGYFVPIGFKAIFNYNAIWIGIPCFFYIVGFYSFIRPNLLKVELSSPPIKTKQEVKKRLNNESISINKMKLERVMIEDKVFTDPELSLSTLATHLEISPNDLSWLLNDVYNTSFYAFINQYRVKEFVAKLEANEHKKQTILAIAMDVGFNSKSTFNKFFKSMFHQTPREYIKALNTS